MLSLGGLLTWLGPLLNTCLISLDLVHSKLTTIRSQMTMFSLWRERFGYIDEILSVDHYTLRLVKLGYEPGMSSWDASLTVTNINCCWFF